MNYVLPYSNFSYLLKIILKIPIVKINPIAAAASEEWVSLAPRGVYVLATAPGSKVGCVSTKSAK